MLNRAATYDGSIQEVEPRHLPIGAECKAERMYSLAVPLVEITDSQQLSRRVIEPMVTLEICR